LEDSEEVVIEVGESMNYMFSRYRGNAVIGDLNFYLRGGKIKKVLEMSLAKEQ
jgi:hypothetical protein